MGLDSYFYPSPNPLPVGKGATVSVFTLRLVLFFFPLPLDGGLVNSLLGLFLWRTRESCDPYVHPSPNPLPCGAGA